MTDPRMAAALKAAAEWNACDPPTSIPPDAVRAIVDAHTNAASADACATRGEAIALAQEWAAGRRSWINLGPHEPYTPDVIAAMDAQEVVKLTALAAVLPEHPPEGTEEERVDAACELLTALEAARRSPLMTVQVMPDGIELIEVDSGDLKRKLKLTEVPG